jgi:hypothetical protein
VIGTSNSKFNYFENPNDAQKIYRGACLPAKHGAPSPYFAGRHPALTFMSVFCLIVNFALLDQCLSRIDLCLANMLPCTQRGPQSGRRETFLQEDP